MKPDRRFSSTRVASPSGPHDGVRMGADPVLVVGSITALVAGAAWLGTASALEPATWVMILVAAAAALVNGWLLRQLRGQSVRVWRRVDAIEAASAGNGRTTGTAALGPDFPGVGLPEGTPAPSFRLGGLHGEVLTLDALRAEGKPVLLVFSEFDSGRSRPLHSMVGIWQQENVDRLTIVLVGRGATELERFGVVEARPAHVLLQQDLEVAQEYRVGRPPSAVLVRADGTIGSQVAYGDDAIGDVVRLATTGTEDTGAVVPARVLAAAATTPTSVSSQAVALEALPGAAGDPFACDACVQECEERGGGASCRLVCELGGSCATT